MFLTDHRPLPNTPMTKRISEEQNNRYGAVLSSLHAFWSSRQVVTRNGSGAGARQDSYSIILFDHSSEVRDLMFIRVLLTVVAGSFRG